MPDKTLVILTHSKGPGLRSYFIALVAKEWQTQGIRVVAHHDLDSPVAADVCLIHVDRSVVPAEYTEFARRYPVAINLHITDIRKRTYSRNRVMDGDNFDGPIIVKSSLNCAGAPERHGRFQPLQRIWQSFHRELTRRASPNFPYQQPSITGKQHYRIFPRRAMLPVGWLDRDEIVVERFRPERHGESFVLREWYFFGDREYYNCEISEDPIFTFGTACPELAAPPPDAIRQVRRDLRIDYGKIDYAIDREGVPALFDVNKTIGRDPDHAPSEGALSVAKILADGLNSFLEEH